MPLSPEEVIEIRKRRLAEAIDDTVKGVDAALSRGCRDFLVSYEAKPNWWGRFIGIPVRVHLEGLEQGWIRIENESEKASILVNVMQRYSGVGWTVEEEKVYHRSCCGIVTVQILRFSLKGND